jgi:tetratricopeptide (TPR) repeat protein
MADTVESGARLRALVDERVALESRLQNEKGELSEARADEYDRQYGALQKRLAQLFRDGGDEAYRITTMLEMMRIQENRLVYLHNFLVDPTPDSRIFAQLVIQFIDQLAASRSTVLTKLEATYYRAVATLYAGDVANARSGFKEACASEESDEANDIKYKSYVILGHLSHEEQDYAEAKHLHDESMRYSQNSNVTAQALAFKALNSYALGDFDEALSLFQEALALFDENQPFFNSYFFRNSLLFCGLIHFDRKQHAEAESYYKRVLENVEPNSYDSFDSLSQLGKIYYATGRLSEASDSFERAVQTHKFNENEYLVDTWFWLARTHLKQNRAADARPYLEKIAASDVKYDKKPQAVELLAKVAAA